MKLFRRHEQLDMGSLPEAAESIRESIPLQGLPVGGIPGLRDTWSRPLAVELILDHPPASAVVKL